MEIGGGGLVVGGGGSGGEEKRLFGSPSLRNCILVSSLAGLTVACVGGGIDWCRGVACSSSSLSLSGGCRGGRNEGWGGEGR